MNSDIAAIVAAARALPRTAPVVVVVANASYAAILANWFAHADALSIANVLVVALDRETHQTAAARGIASAMLNGATSRDQLWTKRAQLFAALAAAGVDFIHSDADAVWLRSPVKRIFDLGVDIAFSQGTVWPPDAIERWGFVVCCGLFGVRAGPAVEAFFSAVEQRISIDADDQLSVNRVLLLKDTVWRGDELGEGRTWKDGAFRIFKNPVFGSCGELRLALLPHAEFPRLPELSPQTLVAHPVTGQSQAGALEERRRQMLQRLGLWRLPESSAMDERRSAP